MLGKVRGWVQICRGATLLFLFCHLGYVGGQIRYPVPEESQEGTFVGNVAQDFLLDTESLAARRLQVAGEVNQRHFRVDLVHTLEKEMATHSSVLAWRTPGMAEPGGLPSMGSHRAGHD